MSSVERLADFGNRSVLVPEYGRDDDVHNVPLIAIVISYNGWSYVGEVENNHWEFLVYGQPTTWADLTDEQRMVVRMAGAWEGQVRDYWVDLRYKDEGWYALEALDQL